LPTIEICGVGQRSPIEFRADAFAVEIDHSLQSHRSLFANDLAPLAGCIYHLGNKECEKRGFFFASELVVESSLDNSEVGPLLFRDSVKPWIQSLMDAIWSAPDVRSLILLTDYQFGPKSAERGVFSSLSAFWAAHDAAELRFNALYSIGLNDRGHR
jgi:hypothetical protein